MSDKLVDSVNKNIVNDEIIDLLYKGLSSAETGAPYDAKNPFIRTRATGTGSSAYGPLQLTGGQGSMMNSILNDPYHGIRTQIGLSDEELDYIARYVAQGENFLKYGGGDMVEGMERYDYGQGGDLSSEKDRKLYEQIGKKIINYEFHNQAGGDVDVFLKNWKMGASASMEDWDAFLNTEGGEAYGDRFTTTVEGKKRKKKKSVSSVKPIEKSVEPFDIEKVVKSLFD